MLRNTLILLCSAAILVSAGNDTVSSETKATHSSDSLRSSSEQRTHPSKNDPSVKPISKTTNASNTNPSNTITLASTTAPSTTIPSNAADHETIVTSTMATSNAHTPEPTTPSTLTTPTSTTSTSTTPSPTSTTSEALPKPTTPITTTTPSISTTNAPPTPVPKPATGKWIVNSTNQICIIVQMAVQFNISYPLNKTTEAWKVMNLPVNKVVVNGTCGKTEQVITLSWNSTLGSSNDSFTLHFVKNDTTKHYNLNRISLAIQPQELPNFNFTSNKTLNFEHVKPQFSTGLSNSYRCLKLQSFNLTQEGKNETVGLIKVDDVQFQAFKSDKKEAFGLAEDCAFDTPDVVPIAVGCALAALVVIVLIAYLVGRKRAQARGYLSM